MADLIDREELKKAVDTWDRFYYVPLQGLKRGSNDDYTALVRINDILHCIDTMPTADVHPIVDTCERCKKKIISVDDYNILIKNHNYFILCENCMEDFEVFMGT